MTVVARRKLITNVVFAALLISSASGTELCSVGCALAGLSQNHQQMVTAEAPASAKGHAIHHNHHPLQHESNAEGLSPILSDALYSSRCAANSQPLIFIQSTRVELTRNTAFDSISAVQPAALPGSTLISAVAYSASCASPSKPPLSKATPIRI